MTEKKPNFLDAIKAAQSVKSKVPKAKIIQREKGPKPSKGFGGPSFVRRTGRGG